MASFVIFYGRLFPAFVPLLIAGCFLSFLSAFFLYAYYSLVRSGGKAQGEIISFDRGQFPFYRGVLVPVVDFRTEDGSPIESQPEHTHFHEFNGFTRNSHVTIYYQKANPEYFVLECRAEVIINWVIIVVTLCSLIWLLIR